MPYNRPGNIFYTNNDSNGSLEHGQLVVFEGRVGVAIKQKAVSWKLGLADQNLIADNEDFAMIVKGIVQVPEVSGFAVGDDVYIAAASVSNGVTTFATSETSTGNTKVGRVVEIEGERGTPTNMVRIDLDAKDSI